VAQDLDDAVIAEIRQALLDHGVIFFRDQKPDAARHKAFTRSPGNALRDFADTARCWPSSTC
jgi:alpha-ketoglutarate-dependent taurine dioxygenase